MEPAGGTAAAGRRSGLIDFRVDPAYRRRGFAVSCRSEAARQFLRQGIATIDAQFMESNASARNMYEKLGFQPIGTGTVYRKDDDHIGINTTGIAPLNVAGRLTQMAAAMPDAAAVVEPRKYGPGGKRRYRHFTFRELDRDSDRLARGLRRLGVTPRTRLALLVRPGIDFVLLVFAMFKAGAVTILIDPGMGRRNLIECLAEAEPEGFIAIPLVHAVRVFLRRKFPKAKFNVTVGRLVLGRADFGRTSRRGVVGRRNRRHFSDDPAAVIFTTGSTGPPKGVLFTHRNFDAQVEQIRDRYDIRPGEIDLPCFPLFGLFNCAMGVTAVIPDMDPTRPAEVDPAKIVEAVRDLERHANLRLAGRLEPGGPLLRRARHPAGYGPPRPIGGVPVPIVGVAADEGLHSRGGRNPYARRRDRGPARRVDRGPRSAE